MEVMTVKRAWQVYLGQNGEVSAQGPGRPALKLLLDDRFATLTSEHLKLLGHGYDLVYLGDDWEQQLPPIAFPGDPETGIGPMDLKGYVQQPDIVRLARAFHADVMDGNFTPGEINL